MTAAKQDINDFNARLKRIRNPRNNSYFDPEMGMHIPKRVSRDKIKKDSQKESFIGAFIVSMIFGAVAVLIAEILRIRYFGLIAPSNTAFFLELLIAFWAVVLISAVTNRRALTARLAQIAGVAVMMVAGHNLIWRWPEQMAVIYTAPYVDQVMATTTQHSIVYRGNVYGL